MKRFDVVIIGGGHNGLVCATYLARAGLTVKILERRHIVGGAAVTEEFHPGFRNSVASYAVSLLHRQIIDEMHLAAHGLEIRLRPQSNFFPIDAERSLAFFGDLEQTQQAFAEFSVADARALPEYEDRLRVVGDFFRPLLARTPPNVGGGLVDIMRTGSVLRAARHLSVSARRDVMRLMTVSVRDFLDGHFENDHIKAAFAFDAMVGNYASPSAPGTAYVLLHHVMGEANGVPGAWGHAVGGMGAITQAMLIEARHCGVDVETSAQVDRVQIDNGAAVGVYLADGREFAAAKVVANVGPKLLFEQLVDPGVLDADFRSRIASFKAVSGTLRMNVALDTLPEFSCAPGTGLHHQSGIVFGPSMDYLERAFEDARRSGWSKRPIVEMLIPSTLDDSLAPAGKHVASLFCQQFAPDVDWDNCAEQAADAVFAVIDEFAPNFSQSVIAREVLTPLDLERRFGLVGGDIFHGALHLNQLWSNRPVMGYADYRMPVRNLYLCGAGAHPGGGVSGMPGFNAAREILRDHRRHIGT